jgi:hypothetical protein
MKNIFLIPNDMHAIYRSLGVAEGYGGSGFLRIPIASIWHEQYLGTC